MLVSSVWRWGLVSGVGVQCLVLGSSVGVQCLVLVSSVGVQCLVSGKWYLVLGVFFMECFPGVIIFQG